MTWVIAEQTSRPEVGGAVATAGRKRCSSVRPQSHQLADWAEGGLGKLVGILAEDLPSLEEALLEKREDVDGVLD